MTQEQRATKNADASKQYNRIWTNNQQKGINEAYAAMGGDVERNVYVSNVALYLCGWDYASVTAEIMAKELQDKGFTDAEEAFLAFFKEGK